MRRGDSAWLLLLLFCLLLFLVPATREWILFYSGQAPYISGFIKFAILATMGDALGKRIVAGSYTIDLQLIQRGLVWGVIGCMVTLVFQVFMGGAGFAQELGYLPFAGIPLAQAFFGSTIMNLTFAPVMNTFHRLLDLWIAAKAEQEGRSLPELLQKIDWVRFVTFNWLQVGICFWIPVHTIVFLLPGTIRVVVAAFCSIILGVILSFAAKETAGNKPA